MGTTIVLRVGNSERLLCERQWQVGLREPVQPSTAVNATQSIKTSRVQRNDPRDLSAFFWRKPKPGTNKGKRYSRIGRPCSSGSSSVIHDTLDTLARSCGLLHCAACVVQQRWLPKSGAERVAGASEGEATWCHSSW